MGFDEARTGSTLARSQAAHHHAIGLEHQKRGCREEAIASFHQAIAITPENAELHVVLGNSLLILRRMQEAVSCLTRALDLNPNFADAHDRLALALWQQREFEAATLHFRRAVQLEPDRAALHCNLGSALHQQGQLSEAIQCYRRALALDPASAAASSNLGNALRESGQLDEAVACCRRAIEIRPDFAGAHNNLGNVLRDLGQTNRDFTLEAVECYRRALRWEPDYPEAHNNLGIALLDLGRVTESSDCFRQALRIKPDYVDAHYSLAKASMELGDLDQAAAWLLRALQIAPHDVAACCHLADTLMGLGNLTQAAEYYRRALQLDSECAEAHLGLGMLLLRSGDLRPGWREYEWRWKTSQRAFVDRGFSQPQWDGRQLAGETVLIYAEQGLGDTIQFVRYAPLVKARGARVLVQCQAGLTALLSTADGIDGLIPWGEPIPEFDWQIPMLSLPRIFDTSLETIPAEVPYLRADEGLARQWQNKLPNDGAFKIGLIWQGNLANPRMQSRSFPVAQCRWLAQVPNVSLYSLQKGPGGADLKVWDAAIPMTDLGEQITDFADTAAIMSQLDLVITCDSAPAHLAGALGVPVWVALCFAADWRWLLDGEDSPWYPSMRLFRQQKAGDWDEVFQRIAQALEERIRSGPHKIDRPVAPLGGREFVSVTIDTTAEPASQALASSADEAERLYHSGNALTAQDKFDEAAACYRRAVQLNPGFVHAHHNLGSALTKQKRFDEAIVSYRRALELKPDYVAAACNLGIVLQHQNRLAEAATCYRRALELEPDHLVAAYNLGAALHNQRQLDEAEACYRRALEIAPADADVHWNQSLLHLLRGNFKLGWAQYESRWQRKSDQFVSRGFEQPLWDGQPFEGKTLLLHAEQGFGDTIQFIRYARHVKSRGGTVIVECQPELVRLLESCAGIDAIVGLGQVLPRFDAQAPLLSLPGIFGTDLDTIPAEIPYLRADDGLVQRWQGKLPNHDDFKVGIVWQSNPTNAFLRLRSFPITHFQCLARVPNVSLFSLQKGPASADLKDCGKELPVTDLGERISDFADTAAIMSQLDLVITCDSAPAHLAGALGVPVWVALPFAADWRWLLDREDSPWYPSMRLFRQQTAGDWDEVFQRIAGALQQWISNGPLSHRGAAGTNTNPDVRPLRAPASERTAAPLGGPHSARLPIDAAREPAGHPLTSQPGEDAERYYRAGNVLATQGNFAEAADCYRRALAIMPELAHAHHNLGSALTKQGQLDEAIACYRRALELKPDYAAAHCNLGTALEQRGTLDEAAACYRRAVELKPDYPEAHYSLGSALIEQGHLDEAVVCFRRALELKPDYAESHNNLGAALQKQHKSDEAMACYRRTLELRPDYAEAHSNLGVTLQERGQIGEALACFERALRLDPEHAAANWNQSLVHLLLGNFDRGWAGYEWRWQTTMKQFVSRGFSQPRWKGELFENKTILLHAEQGFGDTIQFIRYAPRVKARGGTVIVECQPELVRLLQSCPGIDSIVAHGQALPSFDAQVPLMSLPGIFGTDLETIPAEIPYLRADDGLVRRWRNQLSNHGAFKIGIIWQGSFVNPQLQSRSFPLTQCRRLAQVPNVSLYSLQKGPAGADLKVWDGTIQVTDLAEQITDFADTAAIMSQLDLVITCDSATAHLAGALGMPVWVALRFAADWRWLLDRDDSPWYSSMRLFRQTTPGDWDEVFQRIVRALEERIGSGPPDRCRPADPPTAPAPGTPPAAAPGQTAAPLGSPAAVSPQVPHPSAARAFAPQLDEAQRHFRLGNALATQDKLDEAAACYRQALQLEPDYVAAYYNLGTVLARQGRPDEAVRCYRRAVELKPDYAEAHNNLGTVLQEQGQLDDAASCYRQALALKPDFVNAHRNLGSALTIQGNFDEALACYQRTLQLDPNHVSAHWNQSLFYLLKGDLKSGWPEYEWRWRTEMMQAVVRNFKQPLWDGRPFPGETVLLHAEQGMGDTIQFIRYARQVKARGGTVIVECQPELVRLLQACSGIDAIIAQGQALPDFDAQVPLLSLPGIFDTELNTIPAEIPYLRADHGLVQRWRNKLPYDGAFKIGIIWQGKLTNPQLQSRSFPIMQCRRLAQVPNVSLYSLQKGPASADLKDCAEEVPVTDLGEQITDFADTAAIMSQLDLVITCDSAPAHLAGALGVPVWVALRFAGDWRWLLDREDSPWYPSMRLFRQKTAGDWDEVFQRIAGALRELVKRV